MTTRPSPDSPLVARFVASPNHGERRGYSRPNCLILHYTGMPTGAAALKTLTDPASEVSAHYLIWEDGVIDQLVAENDRAWHAGKAWWKGESDLNSASIGVEIVNPGHDGGSPPFPERQIAAAIALGRDHGDLGKTFQSFHQCTQPWSMDSIVIGDQNIRHTGLWRRQSALEGRASSQREYCSSNGVNPPRYALGTEPPSRGRDATRMVNQHLNVVCSSGVFRYKV